MYLPSGCEVTEQLETKQRPLQISSSKLQLWGNKQRASLLLSLPQQQPGFGLHLDRLWTEGWQTPHVSVFSLPLEVTAAPDSQGAPTIDKRLL